MDANVTDIVERIDHLGGKGFDTNRKLIRQHIQDRHWTAPTASLSRRSSKARSVLIYSAPPATWDLRAWCRSGAIARIVAAGQQIGSR
jgi:hypothetical protein